MSPHIPRMIATLLLFATLAILVRSEWGAASPRSSAPTYTVAQVQAGLRHEPGHWLGRTVLVRGIAQGRCGFPDAAGRIGNCTLAPPGVPFFGLIDPTSSSDGSAVAGSLPLLLNPPPTDPPFSGIMRWLHVLPQSHHDTLLWQQVSTYRVHLRVLTPCTVEGLPGSCQVAEFQL